MKRLVLLVVLLFCFACAWAKEGSPELPGELLGQKTRPFFSNDFGRREERPGVSIIVGLKEAEQLLRQVREKAPEGTVAFMGTTHSGNKPPEYRRELVIAPGLDQFDIVRLAGTDGVNHGLSTEDIVSELRLWDSEFGIDIVGAETDTLDIRFKSAPPDVEKFAQRVYHFCPDIVHQDLGSVVALAAKMRDDQGVTLWWD